MPTLNRNLVLLTGLILLAGEPMTEVRAAGPDSSASAAPYRPDPASVGRFGSGYRYPQAGWIVLHIEGEPYERGYQHGRLMAPEIAGFVRELATYRSQRHLRRRLARLAAESPTPLFLRRFDREYPEEMKWESPTEQPPPAPSMTAGRSTCWTS